MVTLRVFAGEASLELELTDEQWAIVDAYRRAHQLTVDEWFEEVVREFLATHPIIAQTRRVQ